MYAILQVNSKQYRITKDDIIEAEKVNTKSKTITLDKVLLYSNGKTLKIGQPIVKEAKVTAEVLGAFKNKKVLAYKYRRRKGYHFKKGHRQIFTRLKIKDISVK